MSFHCRQVSALVTGLPHALIVLSVSGVFVAPAAGQCVLEESHRLQSSSGSDDQEFGADVAIDGDLLVVGAPAADDWRGHASIYRRVNEDWVLEAQLVPSERHRYQLFGWSVAVADGTVVIGAIYDNGDGAEAGAVYVFNRVDATWVQTDRLSATDGAPTDWLGLEVAIDGPIIAAGAPGHDDPADGAGSVVVFRNDGSGWLEETRLLAPDAQPDDLLGTAVGVSGDVIATGTGWNMSGDRDAIYVYRFAKDAWSNEARLVAPGDDPERSFGRTVAIDGPRILAGAPRERNAQGQRTGGAHVFIKTGSQWRWDEKIVAGAGARGDWFGGAVALAGDIAMIGAPGRDGATGTAYLFATAKGVYWTEFARLKASDHDGPDAFGWSVALGSDSAFVGAPYRRHEIGGAYVFAVACPPCISDLDGDGDVGTDDLIRILAAWGPCEGPCPEDLDGDEYVGPTDVAVLLVAWGPCDNG